MLFFLNNAQTAPFRILEDNPYSTGRVLFMTMAPPTLMANMNMGDHEQSSRPATWGDNIVRTPKLVVTLLRF
jgi:hypothetical protein